MLARRRKWLVAIPVAAIVAGCGAASASDPGPPPKAGTHGDASHGAVTHLTVGHQTTSPAVAPGFVGVSTVFQDIQPEAGYSSDPSQVDPVFVQLLKNLAPGAQPVMRIGGDSTDWTWWPVPHMKPPGGVRYTLTSDWTGVVRALAQAANARLIIGVNFEANSRRLAAVEASALIRGVGASSIAALELGNEPELYSVFGWYQTKAGAKVLGRPRGWDPALYRHDYSSVAGALPNIPLAGPSVGGPLWIQSLPQFLHDESRVKLATIHAYPLKVCSAKAHVTIPQLLAPQSSAGLAAQLAPAVAAAHHHGVPLRLDEMNAVSCGGEKGVSDTFATALWSVDFLFELAKIGVSGVNVNSVPTSINSPFSFTTAGNHWSASVRPLYYGMQLFADAAPAGSHLLSVRGLNSSDLRAWATRATDGTVRIVLINDQFSKPANVTVSLPGARPASVALLRAPHVGATSGVTLGGQSYGSSTTTGTLAGAASNGRLAPAHGKYSIRVPPATAALITVPAH